MTNNLNPIDTTKKTAPEAFKDKLPPLTRKQRAFVEQLLANPKISATQVAEGIYNTLNRNVARSIATENLSKPAIKMALGIANNEVESVLKGVVTEWGYSDKVNERTLAISTAQYIHDKIHGKAKQQMDINSSSVSLTIDLTSALGDNLTEVNK